MLLGSQSAVVNQRALLLPSGVVRMPVIGFTETGASCLHEDESYNKETSLFSCFCSPVKG